LYDSFVQLYMTADLANDIFGRLVSSGGWRPALMPEYIRLVMEAVVVHYVGAAWDYYQMKKAVIRALKKLDPVLFRSA